MRKRDKVKRRMEKRTQREIEGQWYKPWYPVHSRMPSINR
jgi:hypothetical protein